MRPFAYERPARLAEALDLLAAHDGGRARLLAGGTDLLIRLRDGTIRPEVVVDVKRIEELEGSIAPLDGHVRFGALATMTDLVGDGRVQRDYPALAEAAMFVGSVQIRNRATLVGNLCNASPAADTAPALLVYGAVVVATGSSETRRIPLVDFFVRSGVTTLGPDELVEAIELPIVDGPAGSVHLRRTRRRGHDLASVTLAVGVTPDGMTHLAFGSVGPRPVLVSDDTGLLADRRASENDRIARLDDLLADASPSPTSMRASPEYRLAMLRVLALRGIATATQRLAAAR
jgi:carbon-monoxide dehydrogenase medium subunit